MKTLSTLLVAIICILSTSCFKIQNDERIAIAETPLIIDSITVLDETSKILSHPASYTFISENKFALATQQGEIAIYNLNGKRSFSFKNIGTGPLEYLDPGFIKFYNNHLYVWCKQLLKIVVFDPSGIPLKEYTGFPSAIRGFEISDNKAYFYHSGAYNSPLIEIYDLESLEFISEIGSNSKESALLTMLPCAGGLNIIEGNVYYMAPGELELHQFSEKTPGDVITNRISDRDFKVEQLSLNKYQKIGNDIGLRVDYVNKNSSIGGLYKVGDFLVIRTEVGEYQYQNRWDGSTFNSSNRNEKYILLDKTMKVVKTFKGPVSKTNNCLIATNGKNLFSISEIETSETDGFGYQLNRINLN